MDQLPFDGGDGGSNPTPAMLCRCVLGQDTSTALLCDAHTLTVGISSSTTATCNWDERQMMKELLLVQCRANTAGSKPDDVTYKEHESRATTEEVPFKCFGWDF